jgi:hypothetical protein
MSASKDLQNAVAGILEFPGLLPLSEPVIRRLEKDVQNDLEAGLSIQKGLGVWAMPPVATSALQGVSFVFFDGYEVRVRLNELPIMNSTGSNAFDLVDAVAAALHWQPANQIQAQVAAVMTQESCDEATALALVQADVRMKPFFDLGKILSYPLALAQRPVEMAEGLADAPGFAHHGQLLRIVDVIFNAVLQVN